MKKVTVELTPLEYAQLQAYLAGYEITLIQHIIVGINSDWIDNYYSDEEQAKAKARYNEAFVKAVKKCGYELNEDAKKKYLL